MQIFGKGFNFSQDGPGNRLVYHLSGCNMRCIWCSNPEGMEISSGKFVNANDIVKECISCMPMFFSGGGVTFTGGEATLQYDELLHVLKALKENNIHTAIETNGTSSRLPDLLPYVDYLIMDFKHYDSNSLIKYTGVGLENVKKNFENNCKTGRQQHIRIPIINNINSMHPEKFAEYFSKHNTENTTFEFLPYHEYGKEKWKSEYLVKDGFITKDILNNFYDAFIKHHLNIQKT